MTIPNFTRLTGLLLVAGFFYSCGTSQVNIDELLANNNYQQAMEEIDSRLSEDPNQPQLYIQRAQISAALAKDTEPELRTEFYTNISNDFESAIEYGANQEQGATIDSLRQQYWKDEHNAGLQDFDNSSISNRYTQAEIHFQNALILRSDAISSYRNLSVTQFNLGNIDDAINSLETALSYAENPSAELYENLGYLYLEIGNPSEAAHYYELANTDVSEDLNLAFGLVNAYISNGDSESAVDILEPLVEENPNNADLRNVYGTQLYEVNSEILEDLEAAYDNNNSILAEQIMLEAEGMGESAEEQLIEAFKRDTSNIEYLESLAVFYNNLSAQYLSLQNVAFDEDKEVIRNKAFTLIDFAIDYYERLINIDPNNEEYTNRLDVLNQLKKRQTSSSN
ncbi:MAG: tetratricopeptide repeat protein [Gracilimonas sp.]|uniref:tetratricopeptide repeat protein n=1 Tax=Gracilimonas sp. TaxID=1974203 RepID=UPI00375131D2|nr:tetratricopeptide repeat protein [Gracilimonas sp.]